MAKRPFIILIASQKGGVGKTTIALNLAVALRLQRYSVLLVDTDIESASLSEQLGIKSDGKGYSNVVNREAEIGDVIFAYEPIDLYIIPGSQAMERVEQKPEKLERFYSMLSKQSFDFIIIDTPPGLFEEAVARYFRDVAIITTPDSVSSNGSARMAQYCDRHKLEHRLIINRAGYSKYDLEREEVEKIYGDVAFLMIPEDKIIAESIMKHKPAYMIDREADFCVAITELAREYSLKVKESQEGEAGSIQEERETQPGFFEKMARWLFKQ